MFNEFDRVDYFKRMGGAGTINIPAIVTKVGKGKITIQLEDGSFSIRTVSPNTLRHRWAGRY